MPSFRRIESCRICENTELVPVLNLGSQYLTGVFPAAVDELVTRGPLQVVRCAGGPDACGLVQLQHSYDSGEMYGDNYGYRSGLNASMVRHLSQTVEKLIGTGTPASGDVVLDIGSNDGTTLSLYPDSLTRVGIDPTADNFAAHYPPDVIRVADFFSAGRIDSVLGGRKAKIITSIAMFYDLERPQAFVDDVASVLAEDGIWHFEQSYLPRMLDATAYDTVCHEHVEYYALRQVKLLLQNAGLDMLEVEINDVNGGSFAVTACKSSSSRLRNHEAIAAIERDEVNRELGSDRPFASFRTRVEAHRAELLDLIGDINSSGRLVLGYGASTKGNVILQYCGLSATDIPCIAEVNAGKFGKFTPGSGIPIVSEDTARAMRPDFLLMLPWHFRATLLAREAGYLRSGGRAIFPLPEIEIVEWPDA